MAGESIYPLFVYGSLRSGFQSPAYEYISRYFDLVGLGRVKGKLYDMGDFPAAIPIQENEYIIGELYVPRKADEFSWAIGQLDDYEGVAPEPGEEQLYRRELADVYIDDKTVKAWIYWYNGNLEGRPHIASGDVLSYSPKKR